MICPKCEYERTVNDDVETPDYECPKCGIIYAKYKKIEYQNKIKKPIPIFVKLVLLLPLWFIGMILSYFMVPGGNFLIFVGFVVIFNWVLDGFGWALQLNAKSVAISIVLLVLFMPYFSSYEAVIDTITGFDGTGQRRDALDAGFTDPNEYRTYLAEIKRVDEQNAKKQRDLDAKQAVLKAKQDALDAKNSLEKQQKQDALAAAAKQAALQDEIAKEIACKKDFSCIGNKMSLTAGIKCPDYIEKLAKYKFEWTDSWLGSKFSRYHWKNASKTVMTMTGDKLLLQNAFGAMQNHIYTCDIDVNNNQVVGYFVKPGKFR